MGKLWDSLANTAESKEDWLLRDNHVAPQALKGKPIPLPPPYNRRNGTQEADTMKRVREVLANVPGLWFRRIEGGGKIVHTGSQQMQLVKSGMTGMPDFIALHKGTMLALEVKAPGGHISPEQAGCLAEVAQAGGIPLIVIDADKLADWFASECAGVKFGHILMI